MAHFCNIIRLSPLSCVCVCDCRKYVTVIILLSIAFYLPKFFEITAEVAHYKVKSKVNCTGYFVTQGWTESASSVVTFPPDCASLNLTRNDSPIVTLVKTKEFTKLNPTALRQNKWYTILYCKILNTLFASLLPIALLFFLNYRTVKGRLTKNRPESTI